MTIDATPAITSSPVPSEVTVERWQPTRAGISNVWRYYGEVFEFYRGRLLLRGRNGAGKSKALELLLPYLLDAQIRSSRLSTFGSNDRTMSWNMIGEWEGATNRVGFVWIEFRQGESYFTCGARLQANAASGKVTPHYFTTVQRIGEPGGLEIVDANGTPSTLAALKETLGELGLVHPSPTSYREQIRQTLFPGMALDRYDSLISALLQLRKPKLSEHLDPGLVSGLLSDALPPIDESTIGQLAEGFERLDRQRENLARLGEEVKEAKRLADQAKNYARQLLRRDAAAVISATTQLDNVTKTARASETRLEALQHTVIETEDTLQLLQRKEADAESRIKMLEASPEFRQGRALDELRRQAIDAQEQVVQADRRSAADAVTLERAAERLQLQEDACEELDLESDRHAGEGFQLAQTLGLEGVHGSIAELVHIDYRQAKGMSEAGIDGLLGRISQTRELACAHRERVDVRRQCESDRAARREEHQLAQDHANAMLKLADDARIELARSIEAWAKGTVELRVDVEGLLANIDEFGAKAADSVGRAVASAVNQVGQTLAVELERVDARLKNMRGELQTTDDEIAQLQAAREIPPPPSRFRGEARHGGGAPLWRVIQFRDEVGQERRAKIESALEASGILDAWLAVDGSISGEDVYLDPRHLRPVQGSSLLEVLVAEEQAAIPRAVIERILAAIGWTEAPSDPVEIDSSEPPQIMIDASGGWRITGLTGRWHKEAAQYIGAQAREIARAKTLAQLAEQRLGLLNEIEALQRESADISARHATLQTEHGRFPSFETLREKDQAFRDSQAVVNDCLSRVSKAIEAVARAEDDVRRAAIALEEIAARLRLPRGLNELDIVQDRASSLRQLWLNWIDAVRRQGIARDGLRSNMEEQLRLTQVAQASSKDLEQARVRAQDLATRVEIAMESDGKPYAEVMGQLVQARATRKETKRGQEELGAKIGNMREQLGVLRATSAANMASRDETRTARDESVETLRSRMTLSYTSDSGLNELESATEVEVGTPNPGVETIRGVLETARRIAANWSTTPHQSQDISKTFARLSGIVHDVRDILSTRAEISLEPEGNDQILSIGHAGQRMSSAQLYDMLRAEREHAERDLTDDERELFDRTLAGDIRRHLTDRIRSAQALVNEMNHKLARIQTASGMRVAIVWEVADEEIGHTKSVRELLLREPRDLSSEDREALHGFFKSRITDARGAETANTWAQQLAEVFDYRAWHQFIVRIDLGSGWKRLTKRLHGALSGGEKAIALHLPLFVAVAAYYESVTGCPRFILLDEVFVGVDSVNRGQVFAMLAELDLDMILTSDHEWCTYPEIDGIAIYQLLTEDDNDVVTAAHFVWDGRQKYPVGLA